MKELEKFLTRAQRQLGLPADSVTVCFVTDRRIARWNRAYRRKPSPTDVLSFPAQGEGRKRTKRRSHRVAPPALSSSSADSQQYIGDIAIAPAVAQRNARLFGRKFKDEMRTLILHGLLHVMGYDHETDTGQMDRRERNLRQRLGLA